METGPQVLSGDEFETQTCLSCQLETCVHDSRDIPKNLCPLRQYESTMRKRIYHYLRDNPSTIKELAKQFNITNQAARTATQRLKKANLIKFQDDKWRGK